ncbi:hypothetical protein SOASR030_34300 [Leminorella grimontii]|uniref:Uncharacterized protein n=1 Tax=Leminorella grimontii TaxID=82981 RepID=A0AAV5N764_9GAMM|nr:hypothetical protein SOASR030_34300 [Leminorella grimontii]GKX61119.1 hypothetical protein SOASR031_34340 [Leminorella grimontii]
MTISAVFLSLANLPASDIRVKIPPSPELSALITKQRYLIETTNINIQKISERNPKMTFGSTLNP